MGNYTPPEIPLNSSTQYSLNDKWLIYWYVCGTDLESNFSEASNDIAEVLAANLSNSNVKILLQTGGTQNWQNNAFPNDKIGRYIYDSSSNNFRTLGTFPITRRATPQRLKIF